MRLPRNRWILVAGVTGTALAVVVAGAVAANAAQGGPADRAPAAAGKPAPPAPAALGTVVDAGFAAGEGSWVIYAVPVREKSLPGTHFGVLTGRRLADGSIAAAVLANEAEGSDRAPGFHAVQAGMNVDGEQTMSFGYYVGEATKITARAGGRTVTARQAAWSESAAIKFFWFDPATPAVSELKAYDSTGRTLPAGHDQAAMG